jgi:sugar lactone lactonase YvrE
MRSAIGTLLLGLVAAGCSSAPARSDFGAGDGGDMAGGDGLLHLAPTTISLARRASQQFSANLAVSWAVVESDGGTVDGNGLYVAPNQTGTFHVSATTVDAPVQSATATVSVEDRSLVLVAGALGGAGTADGIGSAARVKGPTGLVSDGAGSLYFADSGSHLVRKLDVQSGAVTTIAGAPVASLGVDGVGAAARFDQPWSLALDGNGHLYVGDIGDQTIRKIDLQSGAVTTLAGAHGVAGNVDDSGAAARFKGPYGLAWDGKGSLFVADAGNGALRKVDVTSGAVTTFSSVFSGPQALAYDGADTLYIADSGTALTLDKLTISTGALAVVAGEHGVGGYRDGVGPGAHLLSPSGLLLDGAGNLWLLDVWLRKVELATGTVTTVRESSHYGAALAGGGKLYLTSYADETITLFDPAAGTATVIAGAPAVVGNLDGSGSAARFDDPRALVAGAGGALYVADAANQEIRSVAADGTVATISGAATFVSDGSGVHARFGRAWGITSDHAGTIYIAETFSETIRKLVVATGTVTTLAGGQHLSGARDGVGAAARFDDPRGLCFDGVSALYIADTSSHTIRKLEFPSNTVTTLAGFAEAAGSTDGTLAQARFNLPGSVACDGTQRLFVADTGNHTVRQIDLSPGGMVSTVAGTAGQPGVVNDKGAAARFDAPDFIVLDGTRLLLADRAGSTIRAVALADFSATTLATMSGSTGIIGVAVDGGGSVYVGDRNHTVSKIAPGGAVSLLAGDAAHDAIADGTGSAAWFDSPYSVTFDGAGALVLVEDSNCTLRRIALPGAQVTTLAGGGNLRTDVEGTGSAAFYHQPYGLALDGTGALLVSDNFGWTIDRLTLPAAAMSVLSGNPSVPGSSDGAAARFDSPGHLAFDGQGAVYVSDDYDHTIRRVTVADGSVTTIAGSAGKRGSSDGSGSDARFAAPEGLALDGAGRLFVADSGNHTIRVVDLKSFAVTTLAGAAGMRGSVDAVAGGARFDTPTALAYDAAKGILYVSDSGNATIRRVEAATATVSTWAGIPGQSGVATGPLPARLNAPAGLALLPNGDLAISDENAVLVVR